MRFGHKRDDLKVVIDDYEGRPRACKVYYKDEIIFDGLDRRSVAEIKKDPPDTSWLELGSIRDSDE